MDQSEPWWRLLHNTGRVILCVGWYQLKTFASAASRDGFQGPHGP